MKIVEGIAREAESKMNKAQRNGLKVFLEKFLGGDFLGGFPSYELLESEFPELAKKLVKLKRNQRIELLEILFPFYKDNPKAWLNLGVCKDWVSKPASDSIPRLRLVS